MKNKTNEKFRQKQCLKQVVCIVSLEFNWYRTYLTMYQSVQTNLAIVDIVDIILSSQQLNTIFEFVSLAALAILIQMQKRK